MDHYTNEICPNLNHKTCTHKLLHCPKCTGNHYSRDCERLREIKKQKSQSILCNRCYHYGGYTAFCYCENKLFYFIENKIWERIYFF